LIRSYEGAFVPPRTAKRRSGRLLGSTGYRGHEASSVGKSINDWTVDADGVALVSIQALYQIGLKLEEKTQELEAKTREVDELKEEVETLKERVERLEQTIKPELLLLA